MRTGNHTAAVQWVYVVFNHTIATPAFLALWLWAGLPWQWAAILAGMVMPVKVGITGRLVARFRSIVKSSPGMDIPIPLMLMPFAYQAEQAIHWILWPFRIRWVGSGKTEWFIGVPGVVGLIVYAITQAA